MKLISIKCLSNSKTTLEMNELHFESENLAAKIVVDYSSTAVSDWNKVVKCFMADGSFKAFNLNTDPIVEALIDNSVTVAGNMTIQVYAIASGDPNAMKVMFEERIVPFKGITKDGDPAAKHPDLIDEIFLDITNLENTKSDKTYVDTELAKKVDKITGKSLIDDAEIIRLAGVNNYNDTAMQQAITDLDAAKVDKVTGQGLSDQNYTLAEKQKLAGVEAGAQVNQVKSVAGKNGDVTLVKADVGLGNVDNTSDLNKPVSTAQQTAIDNKVDKLFATNLVTNGDFSNGTTGWTSSNSINTILDNTLINTASGVSQYPRAVGGAVFANNKKYFVQAKMRVTNAMALNMFIGHGNTAIVQINTPIENQWYSLSGVVTNPANTTIMLYTSYVDASTANGKVMEVKYVLVIDLTTLFGAGKEPSAQEMDNLLANFPNSWFDGTQELINYKELLLDVNGKANKTQEAWITATLLNGWSGNLYYRKNEASQLEVHGSVVAGTVVYGTKIADIPVGYRPSGTLIPIPAHDASSGNVVFFRARNNGEFGCLNGFVAGRTYQFGGTVAI